MIHVCNAVVSAEVLSALEEVEKQQEMVIVNADPFIPLSAIKTLKEKYR